ncbi:chain length-determining protein [Saccharophagus sp. K07]|uniref:XrtA system polysaccharide chain length determinant n=1 Tax=Saccharophagus sp. K07 TaxID=2283636 RepID=UPI00165248E9|nr:XrtA system polysaccharide chain length determinant [Saccharophagus sp. K07]MBC6903949.1 chain length-determining protein [Saccharophagus sp. K07]
MDAFEYVKDVYTSLKRELIRYRAAAAALFTVLFLAVLYVALNWPKYYVSEAIIVKDITNVIQPLLRGTAEVADVSKNETVQDLILSRRLLDRVISRLHSEKASLSPDQLEMEILRLRRNLQVTTDSRNRNLTNLSFMSADPDDAYETLKAVVDVFIEDRMEEKQKVTYEAHNFISQQVEIYKRRLEKAEEKLKNFQAANVDISEQTVKERISDLTSQLQSLRIAIQESEEKIQTTKAQLEEESRNVNQRARYKSLTDRRTALVEQLDQMRLIYQDTYPDIITLKNQISEIDELIDQFRNLYSISDQHSELPLLEELRKQLSSADVELKTQKRRMISLEDLLEKEYKTAERVAANQAELMDLTRDYEVTKKVYEEMLARKENANITLALNDEGQGESYKVLEPPAFPIKPAGVPAILIFIAAPVVALAAPVGLALVFVVLDPRLRSVALLSQKLPEGVPLLAAVPHRGTPLAARLLRKDIILLTLLGIILIVIYGYTFYTFKNSLLAQFIL